MKILSGVCSHGVDGKNRIRIPNKFKSELTSGGESLHFVQYSEGCIAIMNDTVLRLRYGKFDDIDPTDEEKMEAIRFLLSGIEDVEEDTQGRITLPKSVRDVIGVDKDHTELVMVGMVNYVEIWRADIYAERQKKMTLAKAQLLAKGKEKASQS